MQVHYLATSQRQEMATLAAMCDNDLLLSASLRFAPTPR